MSPRLSTPTRQRGSSSHMTPQMNANERDRAQPSPDCRPDLVGMTHPELEAFFAHVGKERYRATQVMKWIYQGLAESFDMMTNLSSQLRSELSDRSRIAAPRLEMVSTSEDGTRKLLLELEDGLHIET